VGPGVYLAPTLAGKRCISELAPIDLRATGKGKHCKRFITMQQCRIGGRGTGNASVWEAHKGQRGEKRKICRSLPDLSSSLYLLSELRTKTKNIINANEANQCCSEFGELFRTWTYIILWSANLMARISALCEQRFLKH
jgi:hypothetical protein